MGRVIDDRVVEMRFDNKDFEKNVSQSLSTLDKLKNALKIGSSASSEFDSVMDAADDLGGKFNVLENIAVGAFRKMGESVYDWAAKTAINLSGVGNIIEGWKKYESITDATAVLTYQGYDDTEIKEQLARLNWFTDETSYNLSDMVDNISKFTARGWGLKDSADAMMGVALWAAKSGANAQKASRAMYQLSQAGEYMRQMDWMSIQNVGMDNREIRQVFVDTAVELGTLKDNLDGTYTSLVDSWTFGLDSFSSSLAEGKWLTTQSGGVMQTVLQKYAGAVDTIYEYWDAHDEYNTVSEVIAALREEGDVIDEWSLSVFEAAQEARTWTQVVDSVKDALSTGWMNAFQQIFGYYGDAKTFFTKLANELYIFVEPVNALNDILASWADLGGHDDFIEGLIGLLMSFLNILRMVGEAFGEVFGGQGAVNALLRFSAGFKAFGKGLENITNHTKMLKYTLEGIFAVVNIIWTIATSLLRAVFSLFSGISTSVGYLNEGIFALTGGIGILLVKLSNLLKSSDIFYKVFSFILLPVRYLIRGITWLIETVGGAVPSVLSALKTFFVNFGKIIGNALSNAGGAIKQYFKELFIASGSFGRDIAKLFSNIGEKIKWLIDQIKNANYSSIFSGVGKTGSNAANSISIAFGKASKAIKTFFSDLKELTITAARNLGSFWDSFSPKLKKILNDTKSVLIAFIDWTKNNLGGFWGVIKKLFGELGRFFLTISKGIKSFIVASDFEKPKKILIGFWTVIKVVAMAIGAVFYGLYKFLEPIFGDLLKIFHGLAENITLDSIGNALKGIGALLAGIGISKIGGFFSGLTETLNDFSGMLKGNPLKNAAKAILILAAALFLLAQVPFDQLVGVSTQFSLFMAVLASALALLDDTVGATDVFLISKGLQALCIGVLALSAALWVIAKIPTKPLLISAGVISALMLVMAVSFAIIAKFWPKIESSYSKIFKKDKSKKGPKQPKKLAGTILALGLSIIMIAVALRIISKIDPDRMSDSIKALMLIMLGMVALIAVIGLAGKVIGDSAVDDGGEKKIVKLAGTIMAIGFSMILMAAALKIISSISPEKMNTALIGLAAVILSMFSLIAIMGIAEAKSGGIGKNAGKTIMKVAISLLLIVGVLAILASMDYEQFASGLKRLAWVLGLLAALIIVIGIVENAGENGVGAGLGASIMLIAISLYLLIGVINIFANMDWSTFGKGLGMIAICMGLLLLIAGIAGAGIVRQGLLTISEVFLSIAVSALVFAAALIVLKMAFNGLYKILYKIKPVVIELVTAFIEGFTRILEWLPGVIVNVLIRLVASLAESMSTIAKSIIDALSTFLNTVAYDSDLYGLLDALFAIITVILEALEAHIGEWVEILANMLFDILIGVISAARDRVGEYTDELLGLLVDTIEGVASAIDKHAKNFADAVEHLKWAIIRGIVLALTGGRMDLYNAGCDSAEKGVYEGFKDKIDTLFKTIGTFLKRHIAEPIINAVKDGGEFFKKIFQAGKDIVAGLWDGLKEKWNDVKKWFLNKIKGIWEDIKDAFDIGSPSKKMMWIGEMINKGFAIGLDDSFDQVSSTVSDQTSQIIGGFESLTDKINEVMDEEINTNPIISPVLDLTDIKNGTSGLNGLSGILNLRSGRSNLNAIASGINAALSNDPNNPSSGRMVFNQYNYSPKALSPTEIYRQTRNQLSGAKGVVIQKR